MAPALLSDSAEREGSMSWRDRCEQRKTDYVRSIRTEDVCALASYYHNNEVCVEFQESKRGNYNICYFLMFPTDETRWVVRFPLTPLLLDARRKLDCEISTLEYVASRTTIPVPRARAHGYAGEPSLSNPTGKDFMILDYIPGTPLNEVSLADTSIGNRNRFYAQLADFYAQMRGMEFDEAGSVTLDSDGTFRVIAPLTADMAATAFPGDESHIRFPATKSMELYARQLYSLLLRRAAEPSPGLGLPNVQSLVFALRDFENRMDEFLCADQSNKFVLTHGGLQPSNIILGEDFGIKGIIDWEWAVTVPTQFFVPPLWLGKNIVPVFNDTEFKEAFSTMHRALLAINPKPKLATEWPESMVCSENYFIAAALLNQHYFMTLYYTHLFPVYFGSIKYPTKVREFFENDGPDGVCTRQVQGLMEAGRFD